MSDRDDAELEVLIDFIALDLKYANRTNEEIDALCADIAKPKELKEYRAHLRSLRRDAQRSLLDRGADAMLHNRQIEDHRVRDWLFKFLDTEARKIHDKRADDKSERDFHLARQIEHQHRCGKKIGEAIEQIATGSYLSPKRVENIWQEYRPAAKSYWDAREKLIIKSIEGKLAEGLAYSEAIVWVTERNDLPMKRIMKIYPDPKIRKRGKNRG